MRGGQELGLWLLATSRAQDPWAHARGELMSTLAPGNPKGRVGTVGSPSLGEKAQPVYSGEVTLGDPAGWRTLMSTPSGATLYRELTQHLGGRSGRSPRLVQAQIFQSRKL